MADISAGVTSQGDQVPTKRSRSRRVLKEKNPPTITNEANVAAKKVCESSTPVISVETESRKENQQNVSPPKRGKAASKKQSKQCFEKDLLEMQEMLQQLRLEKEKTEELLKVKDEMLKQKDEELDERGREQEKLHMELKKLQKLKEFKPTMNLPVLWDKEQEKKDKKKNGCNEKKRPSPPYILWSKDQWAEIKKKNPEAEFKDISNMLGAKWKTISEEEKQPYEEKYLIEKEAYLRVIAKEKRESEAMKLLEEEQKQKTAMELLEQYMQFKQETEKECKKKKEKDPLKPKHPMSAFILYTNDRRAAILAENKSILEVSKITAEEWKNMTEEQRRPYEEIAKKNKEKYIQEMEAYKQKKDEEDENLKKEEEEQMKLQKQEALQLLKKKEKTENLIKKSKKKKQNKEDKNSDPNRPKRPPSSFLLFSKEARKSLQEERPEINNSTLNALISVKWKELSEAERQVWNNKAAEAMDAYKKKLDAYNKSLAAKLDQKTEE